MRLTLKTKLFAGFGLILLIMLGSGLLSMKLLNDIAESNHMAKNAMNQMIFFEEVATAHAEWKDELSHLFTLGHDFEGQLNPTQCILGKWYYNFLESEHFKQMPADMQNTLLSLEKPHQELHQSAETIISILNGPGTSEEKTARALEIYQNVTIANGETLEESFNNIQSYYEEEKERLDRQAEELETYADSTITVSVGAALLLGIIIAFILYRNITRPISSITERLREMAEKGGDLTQRVEINTRDELADLANWFNKFVDKLREILIKVRDSSDTVATAADEISAGNQDLSQRTEEQASSLEEISSTIEEMTSSLQQAADSASEADRISRATYEKVKDGEQVVGGMQKAMEDITSSSEEIAEIITKVNDIAFQTNLLALNAAVEAARAGEQGRGFAVVAAEVRNLAGRVAESAKDIEKLIKGSIKNVSEGNELMTRTSVVLQDIIQNTERTVDVVGEIAASMREQSSAASEIRTAVEELNQVTQQNASMVEEIASSSEAMQSETTELRDIVSTFKLGTEISRPVKPRRRPEIKSEPGNAYPSASRKENEGDDIFNGNLDLDEFEKF